MDQKRYSRVIKKLFLDILEKSEIQTDTQESKEKLSQPRKEKTSKVTKEILRSLKQKVFNIKFLKSEKNSENYSIRKRRIDYQCKLHKKLRYMKPPPFQYNSEQMNNLNPNQDQWEPQHHSQKKDLISYQEESKYMAKSEVG
ncbi:hypothetical protein O181_050537 [Austropuccinia psidii MF-1]|uniref:Uncharacterized protein n=1 Tax=Austropuccinia psidii MF-1 TaxID=1389203 RepID=A0A9Q3HNP3_9BASI|nr:hypothetical protein [Austropuccinia psidii MF-1]